MKKRHQVTLGALIILLFLLLTGSLSPLISSGNNLYKSLQVFSAILDRIERDYVEEKDAQVLVEKAIQGMVSDLDPHTTYMTAEQYKNWSQNFDGYYGIGVTYDIIRDKITVMSVISKGPSEKVGLRAGDRIVKINGESAIGIKQDEVPLKLMGPRGTTVKISIERNGNANLIEKEITRDEIHLESIPYAFMVRPDVGYINIVRFSATTGREFRESLQKLKQQGMGQLILDLRNNTGGYLEAAVEVLDQFFPRGKRMVYTKGRSRSSFREYYSTSFGDFQDLPVIVLIDRFSASASEIVSGAFQDWDRGVILGETSFGKGLVQNPYTFNDGSALLMTTSHYYTPSGRCIQRDYDGKSLEDYYAHLQNDSLRQVWDADPSRPKYETQILHRDVLGGGGITPDHFLSARGDTIGPVARNIFFAEERYLYTFVEDYIQHHPELRNLDFNQYLRNFKANNGVLQQFVGYIRELGHEISNEDVLKSKNDLQFILKLSIADEIWGDEYRYKVQMLRDNQILESLNHFKEAETLLAKKE